MMSLLLTLIFLVLHLLFLYAMCGPCRLAPRQLRAVITSVAEPKLIHRSGASAHILLWSRVEIKRSISGQMSPSRFWSTEIKGKEEEEEREAIKRDRHRLSLAVNPHPPPVPLACPAVISLWGTAQLCQQLSCLVPLIHFNTQWRTHQTLCAMQDP